MSIKKPYLLALLIFLLSIGCSSSPNNDNNKTENEEEIEDTTTSELPLGKIKLPPGFTISIYAEDVENARAMALSPSGTLFVGSRDEGSVYALKDTDGDNFAETKYELAKNLNMPAGVAFKDGDLYVSSINEILRFNKIDANLENPPKPEVFYEDYPSDKHHGWKFIAFGPDGNLYVPVGAPCNNCLREEAIYSTITTLSPDGTNMEIFAEGVRNTVGFDWHPDTKELWFTENGRDMMGDDVPGDELNRAPTKGMHFGYPFCHEGTVKDPEFGDQRPCTDFTPPVQILGPHVAALGMRFYTGDMFPQEYHKQIFIAEHGSWNRTRKSGYRIMTVKLNGNMAVSYEPFAEGWLDEESQEAWGRPADVLVMPDGALLVADDAADVVYRISYEN